jgi:hypothetical protein
MKKLIAILTALIAGGLGIAIASPVTEAAASAFN